MVSHTDLNRARLPIPPRPHIHFLFAFFAERKIYYTTLISKKQALFSFFYKYFDVFSCLPVRLLAVRSYADSVQENVNLYGVFFISGCFLHRTGAGAACTRLYQAAPQISIFFRASRL